MSGTLQQSIAPVKGTEWQLVLYLVLNVASAHVFLPLLVASMFFHRNVRCHPTLINMCFLWMTFGMGRCVLFYFGYQNGIEPPISICLLQASLVYAQGPTTAFAALILMFQVFSTVYGIDNIHRDTTWRSLRYYFMLVSPYVIMFISVVASFMVGVTDPDRVSRRSSFFRCNIDRTYLTTTVSWVSCFILLITIALEAWIVYCISNQWIDPRSKGFRTGVMDIHLALAVLSFGGAALLSLILGVVHGLAGIQSESLDWLLSIVPYIIFVVFGTSIWKGRSAERLSNIDAGCSDTELGNSSIDIYLEKST